MTDGKLNHWCSASFHYNHTSIKLATWYYLTHACFEVIILMCLTFLISVLFLLTYVVFHIYDMADSCIDICDSCCLLEILTLRFVLSSQQEEKDRETPKDSLDDLFPNDEEEHGQGSKNTYIQQFSMTLWFYTAMTLLNLIAWLFYGRGFLPKWYSSVKS